MQLRDLLDRTDLVLARAEPRPLLRQVCRGRGHSVFLRAVSGSLRPAAAQGAGRVVHPARSGALHGGPRGLGPAHPAGPARGPGRRARGGAGPLLRHRRVFGGGAALPGRLPHRPGRGGHARRKLRKAATTRLFGFEILTAPFVVAHLQLGLALREANAAAGPRSSAPPCTSPTPSPAGTRRSTKSSCGGPRPSCSQEAEAARHVKRQEQIPVIIGNPPYDGYAG
ncbi:MAG: hypothetical protein WKG07_48200 [Hymenobacter sp.]